MTTVPTPIYYDDPNFAYSNLEVVQQPAVADARPGYDIEGQKYYVSYPDSHKVSPLSGITPAEHYVNPPPVVRSYSGENGKIVNSGGDASPEVVPQGYVPYDSNQSPPPPTICGIRRRTFWIILFVVAAVVVVAAVGGGVGGYFASRDKKETVKADTGSTNSTGSDDGTFSGPSPRKSVEYEMNTAAVRWEDQGVRHFRVFFQPTYLNETQILEASWSTDTERWVVSSITARSTRVQPNAPLTAAAGVPHTDPANELLLKNVYFPLEGGDMIERQSPYQNQVGVWGDDNMSKHGFRLSDNSLNSIYWWQDFENRYQILTMFYQEFGANSLTIANYAEHITDEGSPKSHDWQKSTESLSIQDGSPLAIAPRNDNHHVVMYMAAGDGTMQQLPIDLEARSIGNPVSMNYNLAPHNPICVSTEDNTNFYDNVTMPDCARIDPLSHLILFATEDRQDLTLVSWNCSSGFVDATDRVQNLLKPNRTYLSLSSTSHSNLTFVDHRVYVLYDEGEGDGPKMEEWQIPDSGRRGDSEGQNGEWRLRGEVPLRPK